MKQKHLQNIIHIIVNVNLRAQHAIQTKNGIMINISASGRGTVDVRKINVGIVAHVFVRIVGF